MFIVCYYLKIDGKSHYKNYDNNTFTDDTMEATATSQTAKGGSNYLKFELEIQQQNQIKWEFFLQKDFPEGMTQEQINQILFCLSLGRYTPDILQRMTQFGLPHPERGSLDLKFFKILRSTSTRLFNERVKKFSSDKIQHFIEILKFVGDEGQVSGDFPNHLGLNAKPHTLHCKDAKEIISALLEQAKLHGATIAESMTLKLDGSHGTKINVELNDGKLVFSGKKILLQPDIQNRIQIIVKRIDLQKLKVQKLMLPLPAGMPQDKKELRQKELEKEIPIETEILKKLEEQGKVHIAYFQKMFMDITDIEATGVEGSTYEILILGNEMNDLTSAMYQIIHRKTIFLHSELGIPEMELPPQDPDSPQPASQFLQMDKDAILEPLNKLFKKKCEDRINAGRKSTGREPFVFKSVSILKGTAESSVCEGGVLHMTVVFPDETVFRICLKVKNPEMNQEKRNHCVYSETFTEADYYALLKEWLIPAEVPAVLASAGGCQAGEP